MGGAFALVPVARRAPTVAIQPALIRDAHDSSHRTIGGARTWRHSHNSSPSGASHYSKPILGVQVPIVMGIGGVLLGGLLMLWAWARYRGFFRRRLEVTSRDALYS
jgi:hypothetical protein